MIVIDDGSTDDSVVVIERFASRHAVVRLVRNERNRGVIFTVNRGIKLATGDYLTFAPSNDRVLPGFFEKTLRAAGRFPEAGLVFGKIQNIDDAGCPLKVLEVPRWSTERFVGPKEFLKEYLESEEPPQSLSGSTIYRRACLNEVGGFRTELWAWTDAFAIHAIGLRHGACYLPEILSEYRVSPDSFSSSTARDYRRALDIVARAAWLMRSPEFRDTFPAPYVDRWEKAFRRRLEEFHYYNVCESARKGRVGTVVEAVGRALRGDRGVALAERAYFKMLMCRERLRLARYHPDLSCFPP